MEPKETGIYSRTTKNGIPPVRMRNELVSRQPGWFVNEGRKRLAEILRFALIIMENDSTPLRTHLSERDSFMDLPGRRSLSIFPYRLETGTWMVWCATQYGYEHDIADYELYMEPALIKKG